MARCIRRVLCQTGVVSVSESMCGIESRKWACLIIQASFPGLSTEAVNRWVSNGHVYFFSIKCSHWLKVSQTLAWKRVRGWMAVRTGCGLGWDGGRSRRGRWLAKEMTRSLPFVFTACVTLLFSWRLRRASGLRGTRLAIAFWTPDLPAPNRPAGSPQEEPELGLGACGPGPGPAELLHPGAPRRGRGAGSPEAEPEVATEAGRRGGGAGMSSGLSGRGCAPPAIAF